MPGCVGQGCPCTGPVSGHSLLSWESLGPSFWRGESAANHCLRPDPHLTKVGAPPPRPPQVTDTDVSRLLLGRNSQGSTGGRRSEQIDPASLGRRTESPPTLSTALPPGPCALPVRGDMSIDGDCKHGTGHHFLPTRSSSQGHAQRRGSGVVTSFHTSAGLGCDQPSQGARLWRER